MKTKKQFHITIKKLILGGILFMALMLFSFGFILIYTTSLLNKNQDIVEQISVLKNQSIEIAQKMNAIMSRDTEILLAKDEAFFTALPHKQNFVLTKLREEIDALHLNEEDRFDYAQLIEEMLQDFDAQQKIQEQMFITAQELLVLDNAVIQKTQEVTRALNTLEELTEKAEVVYVDDIRREVIDLFVLMQKILLEKDAVSLQSMVAEEFKTIKWAIDYWKSLVQEELEKKEFVVLESHLAELFEGIVLGKDSLYQLHLRSLQTKDNLIRVHSRSKEITAYMTENTNYLSDFAKEIRTSSIKASEEIIDRTIMILVVFGLVMSVVVCIAGIVLLSRINKPLKLMRYRMDEIAQSKGMLNKKIELAYNDEFQQMANSFNTMVTTVHANMKEIEDLNKNLEEKVEERTQELEVANEALVESRKIAALGSLVAGVAHEINTPVGIALTAITHLENKTHELYQHYEQEQMSEEEFKYYIEENLGLTDTITNNLNRTAQLVKSFKQISIDQSTLERSEFNLSEHLHEMLVHLKERLHVQHIEVDIYCDEKLVLNSFAAAFSQVLTNLTLNSLVHAFDERHVKRHVKISVDVKNEILNILYEDNGKGIPANNLAKIFEPFFTTNRSMGGTGLGLNVIYNIVSAKLGGNIECSSEEGKGVVFKLTIPLQEHYCFLVKPEVTS